MKTYKITVEAINLETVDSKFAEKLLILDGAYPKPSKMSEVKNRKCEYKVETLAKVLEMIENGEIVKGDYQRNGDRHNANLGKWLEYTLLNNLPMPNIILVKSEDVKNWNLADGQQRLTAILELVTKYNAVIAKCESDLPKAENEETKKSLETLKAKFEGMVENLKKCSVPITYISGITNDEELYIYSAFNAAKPQTGGEKAFAFLPESAVPIVYDITRDLMPIFGDKAGLPATYIWAALQFEVGKAIAGYKAFPALKVASESENYSPCVLPSWWKNVVDGIKARPTDNKIDLPQSAFLKAGYIVPLIQGIKMWGKGDATPEIITYLLENLNKYLGREVSIIDKPGKGKNGPTMSKRLAASFLGMSGSGAAVVYKRTQTWYKLLKIAEKEYSKADVQKESDIIGNAIAAAEKVLESGEDE